MASDDPYECESDEQIFYTPIQLRRVWLKHCKDVEEDKKLVQDFFSSPQFFCERPNFPFYLGKDKSDGRKLFIIRKAQVVQLFSELSSKLTIEGIPPLPKKCCQYETVEVIFIETNKIYHQTMKKLGKENKFHKIEKQLATYEKKLLQARRLVRQRELLFCSIDIESCERNHSIITEIGWTLYNSRSNVFCDRHVIIKENQGYNNGRFVLNNKMNFQFGNSEFLSLSEAKFALVHDLHVLRLPQKVPPLYPTKPNDSDLSDEEDADWDDDKPPGSSAEYPLVIIGHNLEADLTYLKTMDIHLAAPLIKFDTLHLYMARTGAITQFVKLEQLVIDLGGTPVCMHNAGNDAHYTMEAFFKLLVS